MLSTKHESSTETAEQFSLGVSICAVRHRGRVWKLDTVAGNLQALLEVKTAAMRPAARDGNKQCESIDQPAEVIDRSKRFWRSEERELAVCIVDFDHVPLFLVIHERLRQEVDGCIES